MPLLANFIATFIGCYWSVFLELRISAWRAQTLGYQSTSSWTFSGRSLGSQYLSLWTICCLWMIQRYAWGCLERSDCTYFPIGSKILYLLKFEKGTYLKWHALLILQHFASGVIAFFNRRCLNHNCKHFWPIHEQFFQKSHHRLDLFYPLASVKNCCWHYFLWEYLNLTKTYIARSYWIGFDLNSWKL